METVNKENQHPNCSTKHKQFYLAPLTWPPLPPPSPEKLSLGRTEPCPTNNTKSGLLPRHPARPGTSPTGLRHRRATKERACCRLVGVVIEPVCHWVVSHLSNRDRLPCAPIQCDAVVSSMGSSSFPVHLQWAFGNISRRPKYETIRISPLRP